ncbi:MAG: ATP-binding protein [Myxococcaceae bacterium]
MLLKVPLTLITCAGALALALLVFRRGARTALGFPLAALALVMFAWNLAGLEYELSGHGFWNRMDLAASPLTGPLVLHLVLSFVGQRRRLEPVLYASYGAFGLLSAVSLADGLHPDFIPFTGFPSWADVHLSLLIPVICGGTVLLLQHLRNTPSAAERFRTGILLLAAVVITALGSTEILAAGGLPVPRLGPVGSLLFSALLVALALRLRVFGPEKWSRVVAQWIALTFVCALAWVILHRVLGRDVAVVVALIAGATLTVAAIAQRAVRPLLAERDHLHEWATLGRFSAQLAHDLKNPLAALKGATQFLKEEVARGTLLQSGPEFIDLIHEQAERLQRVVDQYQRLARVEPLLAPMELNQLVGNVLALQAFASTARIQVRPELADQLPACELDPDLVSNALENLLRNAFEAMPSGGTVSVKTAPGEVPDRIVLSVEDTGRGMNARTRERAFDPLFTTKASGSGLGLAFVRQVVEAHGGTITLSSREGSGTVVRMNLPCKPGRVERV